jgi:ADP-heptose:LPS heptosyltransferase
MAGGRDGLMGYGDDVMASAEAKIIAESGKLAFMGAEWSAVWENNPNVTREKSKGVLVSNRLGYRPYIKGVTAEAIIYNENHKAPIGQIFLTDAEKAWARQQIAPGYILVEPHIKGSFAGNKAWIWDRWVELAKRFPVVQCKAPNKRPLSGARVIETESVRQAFAVLAQAKLVITTDGAMHHAAAALGVPAVVLWGARTHPKILGYEAHKNIYTGQGESCGMMALCNHCRDAMRRITVDMVSNSAKELI